MDNTHHVRPPRGRRVAALAAVTALVLVVAACSSSKPGTSSSTPTGGGSAIFGTPHAATGATLKVGYITDGQNGSINNLTEIPSAQAAVKYVNAYLGGIAGDVLSLDICDNHGTPSGATTCANQMIADKVPVVLNNVSAEDSTIYTALSAAGVPYVAYQTAVAAELLGKHSYVLTNGLASSFAGPAKVAQNVKAKRAAQLVINVPAAAGPAQQLDPILYKNAGVPVDVVPIAPGTPDMTPQVQAEISKGVDIFAVLGDVSFCTSALKALKTLNYTGPITLIAQCISSGSSAGIPGGYAGDIVITVASTAANDPDVQLYEAAMKQWAPGTGPFANGVTQGGFATVLAFARSMKGLTLPATSASIEAAFAAMPPTPLPFGGGGTIQCNGKQVSITPAICSAGALSASLDAQGNPTGSFTPLDVSSLLKL